MERLIMLGRDYPVLGQLESRSLGPASACISAGRDAESPSYAYKGNKGLCPNEDGLVILRQEGRCLLAVADGHLGHQTNHALLQGLSELSKVPPRLGPLSLALASGEWIEQTAGGSTLLVACLDETNGSVFGISFGDSSLVTLGPGGAKVRNELNEVYVRGGEPIQVEDGRIFQFQMEPESLLLLYTDGVNECCYRDPFRSVKLSHLEDIFQICGLDSSKVTQRVMELALAGVDDHPGGQDNVAIAAFAFSKPNA